MEAIRCEKLFKTYGSGANAVQAVRGVDLTVNTGELLLIVGPSGSGKTTLISILAGILPYQEGVCRVFGEEYKEMNEEQKTVFRKNNIGFVFQSFNLIPMLSAVENVAVPLLLNGVAPIEAEIKAQELLSKLDLQDKFHVSPRELSGGQQQRLAIARGFIHEPKLIVCDEPTAYLDHKTGEMVMEILKNRVLNKDRAIIVVTHDPRIFSYADRVVHMEDGLLVEKPKS
ncbi:MAG: ABC transporter ATP-binding protein [Chlamydiae bacterium]|nr:ABC transporter ATP-binding protein [Chlamydiota bacterium]